MVFGGFTVNALVATRGYQLSFLRGIVRMYSFGAADCAFRVKPFVCSLSLLAKGIVLVARRINFNEQKLEIRQALWDGQLVAPKTTGSVRTIYFGP